MQGKHQQKTKPQTRTFLLKVDDEKPHPSPAVRLSPRDELREIYRKAAGTEISGDVLQRFFETIELRGVPIDEAMNELREHHVPHMDRWRNPDGFLTDFAKRVRTKFHNSLGRKLELVSVRTNRGGLCTKCQCGYLRYDADLAKRAYCDCELGRDLKLVDDRMAEAAAKNSVDNQVPVVIGSVE